MGEWRTIPPGPWLLQPGVVGQMLERGSKWDRAPTLPSAARESWFAEWIAYDLSPMHETLRSAEPRLRRHTIARYLVHTLSTMDSPDAFPTPDLDRT